MAIRHETTLARHVRARGVGIHTGEPVEVEIRSAPAGVGLRMWNLDDEAAGPTSARLACAKASDLSTEFTRKDGTRVRTIEHVFAALWGCGIDNADIFVRGAEMPIMDGSAAPLVRQITAVAAKDASGKLVARRRLRALAPVCVEAKGASATLEPDAEASGLNLNLTIDFAHPAIGCQSLGIAISPSTFRREIAAARTFGFRADFDALRARGAARGADLSCVAAIDDAGLMNPGGWRMPDECARHKALDAIGDLALLGKRVAGRLRLHRAGHALHLALARAIEATPDAWRMEADEA